MRTQQQGRPRSVAISLSGSYKADGKGRLITKPVLTDADGNLTATKAEMEAYIRQRRAQAAISADPLGLLTGEYRKREKRPPNLPTRERVARGREVGEILDQRQVLSDKGEPLPDVFIIEITPVLRELKRRGTLDGEEYTAALQLCRDYYGARFPGPVMARYQERVDGSSGHNESEYMFDCRKRFSRAWKAVDPIFEAALAWIVASLGDSQPLSKLGAFYAPCKPVNAQSTRGADALRFACDILCRHYGIDDRFSRQTHGDHLRSILALID